MTSSTLNTRPATIDDINNIYQWTLEQADSAKLLPLTKHEIREKIAAFIILQEIDSLHATATAIGCATLDVYNDNLAEIRTLVIAPEHQHKGGGKILVHALEEKAQSLKINRLIALTYVPLFFHKLGYTGIDRSQLPEKIWRICIRCPKFFMCDEVAVFKDINKNP